MIAGGSGAYVEYAGEVYRVVMIAARSAGVMVLVKRDDDLRWVMASDVAWLVEPVELLLEQPC